MGETCCTNWEYENAYEVLDGNPEHKRRVSDVVLNERKMLA
jgi:hypothetical protein